ncbi:MAG TPA: hypothetical protein IAB15_02535 [Candidatus Ornithoclostridium faecigallinarum]|nr:hypothetical protein [Candidatus Ornithoclostridium faecigallinarum]
MKRFFGIFVSVLIIVALCVVFVGCERGGDLSRYTIEEVAFDTTYDVVSMTKEISERYPNRTSGSEAEASQGGGDYDVLAAGGEGGYAQNDYIFLNEYVAPKMSAMGYLGGIEQFRFTDVYDGSKLKDGFNGVWTKAAAGESKGEIWIVAAYDNSVGITVSNVDLTTGQVSQSELGGEGTYGSATSVAAALAIADRLAEAETQYDLTFAFVGCSQFDNEGIREMLAEHGKPDLVVNLNRLGGGTYNYIYSVEVETDFNDAFYAAANTVGGGTFKPVPGNTHAVAATMIDGQPNDYTHIGMVGDNLITMSRGIPTVSFLSLDWGSDTNSFYTEIDGKENIYNTSGDTYENMIARLGENGEETLRAGLNGVADTVATMLAPENGAVLAEVLATAPAQASVAAQQSHAEAGMYTRLALIIAAVIAAVALTMVGRNKHAKETMQRVNEAQPYDPNADVFDDAPDDKEGDDGQEGEVKPPEDPFEY